MGGPRAGPTPAGAVKSVEVLATGAQVLVQDRGRPGFAAVGVTRSGAADRAAYELGQRLLDEPAGRAALEVLLGGLQLRARDPLTGCLTGAPAPADVDGRPVGPAAPFFLAPGQRLRLGVPPAGLRTYLAIHGGIDVPPVLGSRSTDTLSGLGPPPVQPGDVLPIGAATLAWPVVDAAPACPPSADRVTLTVLPGPRTDWLADPAVLTRAAWAVTAQLDRIGLRLDGPVLQRHPARHGAELPSEGVVRGAVQVPPDGRPVIFLADHPVTGGYPVVAVLTDHAADRAAQLRPGQPVRLRWVDG